MPARAHQNSLAVQVGGRRIGQDDHGAEENGGGDDFGTKQHHGGGDVGAVGIADCGQFLCFESVVRGTGNHKIGQLMRTTHDIFLVEDAFGEAPEKAWRAVFGNLSARAEEGGGGIEFAAEREHVVFVAAGAVHQEEDARAGCFTRDEVVNKIERGHERVSPLPGTAATESAVAFLWRKQAGSDWLERHEAALMQASHGAHAAIERPGRKRVMLEVYCETKRAADALANVFGGSVERLAANWKERLLAVGRLEPLRVGDRLMVVSESQQDLALPSLFIPAGMAFGTGEHATTAMSLRLLEQITRGRTAGWRLLDAGTGSGILALAARRFGAGEVVAIENDPIALRTAQENARRNRIRGVRFLLGDARKLVRGRFEIIAANLFSELLIEMLPRFRKCLVRDGRLILSGVLREQGPALRRALGRNGFRVAVLRRRGKWLAMLAAPSSSYS